MKMKRKPPAPSTGPGPGGMDGDRPYLAAADLLRVFSVGLVAWFHIWQQSWLNPGFSVLGTWVDLQRLVRRGYMMVDLLLLLSGFLLYLPCARRRSRGGAPLPDVPKFYRRRLARILPSYLLAMGVGTALLLGSAPAPGSPPLWKDLLTHLTFTYTFFADTYLWTNLNGALWTLAVEMQFYLLFPLAARLFARRPWRTWAGMTALALLCRWGVAQMADPTLWINQLPCMLDLYAFGMLAAHLLAAGQAPFGGAGPGRRRPWPACWRWEPSCGPRIPRTTGICRGCSWPGVCLWRWRGAGSSIAEPGGPPDWPGLWATPSPGSWLGYPIIFTSGTSTWR